MKVIFDDLKLKFDIPIQLYCDNNSAMNIIVQHDMTKHLKIDIHFNKVNLDRSGYNLCP